MLNYQISKKNNKMIKIKTAMEKLQRSLQLGKKSPSSSTTTSDTEDSQEETEIYANDSSTRVPEGHFAVLAIDGELELAKRFAVPLRCLANPNFIVLLERAAEEYGFDNGGVLTIPCRLSEMERVLGVRKKGGLNRNIRSLNSLIFA